MLQRTAQLRIVSANCRLKVAVLPMDCSIPNAFLLLVIKFSIRCRGARQNDVFDDDFGAFFRFFLFLGYFRSFFMMFSVLLFVCFAFPFYLLFYTYRYILAVYV